MHLQLMQYHPLFFFLRYDIACIEYSDALMMFIKRATAYPQSASQECSVAASITISVERAPFREFNDCIPVPQKRVSTTRSLMPLGAAIITSPFAKMAH